MNENKHMGLKITAEAQRTQQTQFKGVDMVRFTVRSIMTLAFILLVMQTAWSNNVVVSNTSLIGQDAVNNFTFVQFNITWENSWRDAGNHDASWVFVKFSVDGGATWNHATLAISGHMGPGGSTIDTPNDGKGVFIFRDAVGSGTITLNGVQLKWDYGTDGVSDDATVQVKVIAIEMVYIPEATFSVGSGGTEDGHFFEGGGNNPFQISSEAELPVGNAAGQLFYVPSTSGNSGDAAGPIPSTFPKGFNAFYMMKYEITQEQYKDFLNCLTFDQQNTRTQTSPDDPAGTAALFDTNLDRNGIDIQTPGTASTTPAVYANNLDDDTNFNEANDGQNIACGLLSWLDGSAYADWAGLRPMTELEFEKACRGDQTPVVDEFAWGTANIASSAYTLANPGAANENINTNYATSAGVGNASYNTTDGDIDGPLRVGIFAGNAENTIDRRVRSGAGFYGNMEMSGNVFEQLVTIGNAAGRGFLGTLGDGSLSVAGNATNGDWPGFIAGEVTGGAGSGIRGGGWFDIISLLRVSDRRDAALNNAPNRDSAFGFRCVRQAPSN